MKHMFIPILVLFLASVSAAGQAVGFPHDVFDPVGIPPIEGANVLHVERTNIENSRFVVFDATPEQVVAWMKTLEQQGMICPLKFEDDKVNVSRGKNYNGGVEINYYFPEGSEGDRRSLYLYIFTNFVQTFTLSGDRTIPGSTVAIELLPMYRSKPELEYEHGVLSDMGITDESSFIPAKTHIFTASIFRTDDNIGSHLPSGTPLGGSIEAKFTYGYVPTLKEADAWVGALRKASTANAQSFEDMGSNVEGGTAVYWWSYVYRGVTYLCSAEATLDHLGRFSLIIQRIAP